ncbi:MAG TPA: hypothetical protein VHO70_13640 [Chitinispirillaceae bacterium]|nr:hypothetical protein [Chitinispirillaceae bacterium]
MYNLYDLYEGENKIQRNLTAGQVKEFAGISKKGKLNAYYNDGFLLCGKYTVVVSGHITRSEQPKEKKSEQEYLKAQFLFKFGMANYNGWKEMCKMFEKAKHGWTT